MLTFKRNGYTSEALKVLSDSIVEAACNMCIGCERDSCANCLKALPQQDLLALTKYLEQLISQA